MADEQAPQLPRPREGAGMNFGKGIQGLPKTRRRDPRDLAERILDLEFAESTVDYEAESRQEEADDYLLSNAGQEDFMARYRDNVAGLGDKSSRIRQVEKRRETTIRREEQIRAQARAEAEARTQRANTPVLAAPVLDLDTSYDDVESRYEAWINGAEDEMFEARDDGW
jgi:hypothetical protein